MVKLKLPPRIKILEGLYLYLNGYVKKENNYFIVYNPNLRKEYKVFIKNNKVYSNDSGTLLKRFIGFPIIATLFYIKYLDYPEKLKIIKDLDFYKIINKKNRYYLQELELVKKLKSKININILDNFLKETINKLKILNLELENENKF